MGDAYIATNRPYDWCRSRPEDTPTFRVVYANQHARMIFHTREALVERDCSEERWRGESRRELGALGAGNSNPSLAFSDW
jgi:hypothetical protein